MGIEPGRFAACSMTPTIPRIAKTAIDSLNRIIVGGCVAGCFFLGEESPVTINSVPIRTGFNFADRTFDRNEVAFRTLGDAAEGLNESQLRRKQQVQNQFDPRNLPSERKLRTPVYHTEVRFVDYSSTSAAAFFSFSKSS